MSAHRRVFAFLASLLVLSAVRGAPAQVAGTPSVTLPTTGLTHSIPVRSGNRLATQLNFADCEQGDVLKFSVTIANGGNLILQAWAGTGCDQLANRTNSVSTLCWKLYDSPAGNTGTLQQEVDINVRDLLAGITLYGGTGSTSTGGSGGTGGDTSVTGGTGGDTSVTGGTGGDTSGTGGTGGDTGGSSGTTGTTATGGGILATGTLVINSGTDACIDKTGVSLITPINVYFMLVDGTRALQGTFAQWAGTYKLLAPAPPATVTADIGEDLLPLHFSSNQSGDKTLNGYQFFCDPPPGLAAAEDAGVAPGGGEAGESGDGGLVIPVCTPSSLLEPGTVPDQKFLCGSTGPTATAGNATGLVNGVAYHVGVATKDTYDNVGKLSVLACNVPQPVNGFFKAYRLAGGQGGGGFCSFATKREPVILIALLGLAASLVLRRRRAA